MAEKLASLNKSGISYEKALKPAIVSTPIYSASGVAYAAGNVPYLAKTAKLTSISPLGVSVISGLSINASSITRGGAYWDITTQVPQARWNDVWTHACLATIECTY